MSWMKRPGRASAGAQGNPQGPDVPIYNPNTQQPQWTNNANQPQNQYSNKTLQQPQPQQPQQTWYDQSQSSSSNIYNNQPNLQQNYWTNQQPQPTRMNPQQVPARNPQLSSQNSTAANSYQNLNMNYPNQYTPSQNVRNSNYQQQQQHPQQLPPPQQQQYLPPSSYFNSTNPGQYVAQNPTPVDNSNNFYDNSIRSHTPKSGRNSVQGAQSNYNNASSNFSADSFEVNEADPWNWGWEDSTKNQPNQNVSHVQDQSNMVREQIKNQANAIVNSFGTSSDDNWNWSVDDKSSSHPQSSRGDESSSSNVGKVSPAFEKMGSLAKNHRLNSGSDGPEAMVHPDQAVPQLNSPVQLDQTFGEIGQKISPPDFKVGRRIPPDALTPQWSIESQVSQDSYSERSPIDSATISHSTSFNEHLNVHQDINQGHPHVHQEINNSAVITNRREYDNFEVSEAISGFQSLNITQNENREVIAKDMSLPPPMFPPQPPPKSLESKPLPPPPTSLSVQSTATPLSSNVSPLGTSRPPLPDNGTGSSRSMPPLHVATMQGLSIDNHSSFPKTVPPLSKVPGLMSPPRTNAPLAQIYQPPNYIHQEYQMSFPQESNLESLPDNSERPDQIDDHHNSSHPNVLPPYPHQQNVAENLEIAPNNERNQYLQTGHLSESEYNNTNSSQASFNQHLESIDAYPPPGLSRLVLGQTESGSDQMNYIQNSRNPLDEPPPGLDRMIPGQLTDVDIPSSEISMEDRQIDGQTEGENVSATQIQPQTTNRFYGMQRLIPGGTSASPSYITQQNVYQSYTTDPILPEERVVTGLEYGSSSNNDRVQNIVGSELSESTLDLRNADGVETSTVDSGGVLDNRRDLNMDGGNIEDVPHIAIDEQREINMEGENLQDPQNRSEVVSDLPREENVDGANLQDDTNLPIDTSFTDSTGQGQSLKPIEKEYRKHREDTTDDSEKERRYKESRRDKERSKTSRDKDIDRKYRDDKSRRHEKDRESYRERDRGDSYGREYRDERDRRQKDRRSTRERRYETEDTDYYSDRERKRYREGSVRDKDRELPRDRDLPRDRETRERFEREKLERDRKYGRDERDSRDGRDRDRRRGGSRYDRRYDYEDPYYARSGSRTGSVEARERVRVKGERDYNPYYQHPQQGGYNGYDPYSYYAQQQSYQYYENLRRTNPQAYAEWYRKYYANGNTTNPYVSSSVHDFPQSGVDSFNDDRGSVHSGRSSANEKEAFMNVSLHHQYYAGSAYFSSRQHNLRYPQPQQFHHSVRYMSQSQSEFSDSNFRELNLQDSSLNLNLETSTVQSQRLTPAKFPTAHIKSSLTSGHLLTILPAFPSDGNPPAVEIHDVSVLTINDPLRKELTEYPGPLVKGVTHKKTVIEFCEDRLNKTVAGREPDSYSLLWELMILLLRQNGMVVGTDIAELLMKHKSKTLPETSLSHGASTTSLATRSSGPCGEQTTDLDDTSPERSVDARQKNAGSNNNVSSSIIKPDTSEVNRVSEKIVTDKFREFLIYGNGKEALEWAMSNGLWGHALFLASKLDKRTYANVMMRFANGLPFNDPLQTLYQLMSGRQPAAVTCALDEKWGDWKPHLAMILSNTSQRPDLDRKAITTLGDTLMNKGDLYAAQFCYLMAQVSFGKYTITEGQSSTKLVLLGSCHQKTLNDFATNEAIMLTEVYEYACTLSDPNFFLADFQPFKYLLGVRILDYGLHEKTLLYMENISQTIQKDPSRFKPSFIQRVYEMGDRLKYYDPLGKVGDIDGDSDSPIEPNQSWLQGLRTILSDYDMGLINHESTSMQNLNQGVSELDVSSVQPAMSTESQQQQYASDNQPQYYQQQNIDAYQQQQYDQSQQYAAQQQLYSEQQQQPITDTQTQYDPNQQQNYGQQYSVHNTDSQEFKPAATVDAGYQYGEYQQPGFSGVDSGESIGSWTSGDKKDSSSDYWAQIHQQQNIYQSEPEKPEPDSEPLPQISMPNASAVKRNFMDDSAPSGNVSQSENETKKKEKVNQPNKNSSSNSGWFGGIWNKLSMRPKNQMILPDDKNPTIVWDPDKKKWTNVDGEEDVNSELKPPPKMADMFGGNNSSSTPVSQISSNNIQNGSVPMIPTMSNPMMPSMVEQPVQKIHAEQPEHKTPNLQSNMFKMQRNRTLKKSYVDVFNPGGAASAPPPAPLGLHMASNGPVSTPNMGFFIPEPVSDQDNLPTDFLTQTTATHEENAPPMYNPNQYTQYH